MGSDQRSTGATVEHPAGGPTTETVAPDLAEGDAAELAVDGLTGGRRTSEGPKPRSGPRRALRRAKRWTVVTHRWLSLVLGIVLVVVTTSGAIVVFAPEFTRWTRPSVFEVTETAKPVTMSDALHTVDDAHPRFGAGSVNKYHGLYEVYSADDDAHPGFYGVDPGTGRITGYVNPNAGFMAFMDQVHECFFTCDDYPGYVAFLNEPVPTLGMHWLQDVTWGGLILGLMGLLLIFLAVSGIWLWWPTIKRFSRGFKVRTGKGRFARDYDLHQVIGIVAVPFLLMWGITGASFEFHWVSTAWYAVTGGQQLPDPVFTSHKAPKGTADLTVDEAVAASRTKAGRDAELVYVSKPDPKDKTAYYDLWYSKDFDPYGYGAYPGQYEVTVDRHDASHLAVNDYGTAPTVSNQVLDRFGYGIHYGQSFNGWWRIIWVVFGLTPLVLAITALSTWLAKRGVRKQRKRARQEPPPSPGAPGLESSPL